ncbi:MAG: hypothetical protein ACT4OO_15605 [Nitrospiraceae bacterium]
MKATLLAVLSVFLLSGVGAAQDTTDQNDNSSDAEAVMHVVEDFIETWNRDDVNSFVSLFTPDGKLVTPKGISKTQHMIEHVIVEEHPEIFFGTNLSERVDSIGFPEPHHAEVTGHFLLCCVEVLLGFEASSEGLFFLHLIDQDGEWKIERASITES